MKKYTYKLAVGLWLMASLASCVSNKKHQAALDTLQVNHKAETDQWRTQVNAAKYEIEKLQLQLAERKGENNILQQNADKWELEVDELEAQIESMANRSSSNQKDLNQQLRERERQIASLKNQLGAVGQELDRHQALISQLQQEMKDSLRAWPNISYSARAGSEQLSIILPEAMVFRKGSTTRLEEDGYNAIGQIATVLERYPSMSLTVIGHTDNSRPKSKAYKDNWNFSLLQSATVVRTLVEDFDLSTGQLLPGGKGEFAPRASNGTKEGRQLNRRIEFVIKPLGEQLSRAIRSKL
ncbi:MAG: OmpA family protein [Bacteroidota bacterium]